MEAAHRQERLDAIDRLTESASATESDIALLLGFLDDPDKQVQRRAAEELARRARFDVDVLVRLTACLADEPRARRWGAAYSLALIGPPPLAALPVLLEVLGHEDGDLRWAASTLMRRMKAPIAAELVRLVIVGSPTQRKMALYCLRDLGADTPPVEQAILAALADGDAGVRLAALSALSRVAVDRAIAARRVSALVEDPDDGVRRAAIGALGELGHRSSEVVELVRRAASHPADAGLRRAALRAMKRLETSPAES